jgi:hypothetical protein
MSPKPITENTLFYGDNLPILREHIADESVGLETFKQRSKQTSQAPCSRSFCSPPPLSRWAY